MHDAKGYWICFGLFLCTYHRDCFDVPGDYLLTPPSSSGDVCRHLHVAAIIVNFIQLLVCSMCGVSWDDARCDLHVSGKYVYLPIFLFPSHYLWSIHCFHLQHCEDWQHFAFHSIFRRPLKLVCGKLWMCVKNPCTELLILPVPVLHSELTTHPLFSHVLLLIHTIIQFANHVAPTQCIKSQDIGWYTHQTE